MKPFISAEELGALAGAIVCDVRWGPTTGPDRAAFDAGHLPGARFVDLDRDLSGPASAEAGRHPLPDPDHFAAAMSRLGIGDGATVVAYDGTGGVIAARLVWMLRALGERAALLDGGIAAWQAAGGQLAQTEEGRRTTVVPAPAQFTPRAWPPDRIASIDDASGAREAGVTLVDARPGPRYRGEPPHSPLDPRPGHIPGARSLPVIDNVNSEGRLLGLRQLAQRFYDAGAGEPNFISSCGSGVTACHNLLVAEHIGLGKGRLYPGSWSQYAADPDRPATLGSE